MNHIIGLDLSLTATGLARYEDGTTTYCTVPGEGTGLLRMIGIEKDVLAKIYPMVKLVVCEELAFTRNDPSSQERAGLAYFLRRNFFQNCVRYILVAPNTLKKFVTGKGNAEKSLMLREVYRRWDIAVDNDNEADAVGLCMIGACLLGHMEPQTDAQREVLSTIATSNPGMFPDIPVVKKAKKSRTKAND